MYLNCLLYLDFKNTIFLVNFILLTFTIFIYIYFYISNLELIFNLIERCDNNVMD